KSKKTGHTGPVNDNPLPSVDLQFRRSQIFLDFSPSISALRRTNAPFLLPRNGGVLTFACRRFLPSDPGHAFLHYGPYAPRTRRCQSELSRGFSRQTYPHRMLPARTIPKSL